MRTLHNMQASSTGQRCSAFNREQLPDSECNAMPRSSVNGEGVIPQGGVLVVLTALGKLDAELVKHGHAMISNALDTIEKVVLELGLSPQEKREAIKNLISEIERRLPQVVTVLFVIAMLPLIGSRAYKHFRRSRHEMHHDAEDLSQSVVEKILQAFTGLWPRGNVGALLAVIREHLHVDHIRKRASWKAALERLEQSCKAFIRG